MEITISMLVVGASTIIVTMLAFLVKKMITDNERDHKNFKVDIHNFNEAIIKLNNSINEKDLSNRKDMAELSIKLGHLSIKQTHFSDDLKEVLPTLKKLEKNDNELKIASVKLKNEIEKVGAVVWKKDK